MNELPTRTQPPNTNGHHAAPPAPAGGAVRSIDAPVPARAPTVFPADLGGFAPSLLLYKLGRGHFGGFSLLRWLWLAGGAAALAWPLGLPGGVWVSGAMVILLAALTAARVAGARRFFVRFDDAGALPDVTPARMPVPEKLPVHVTGLLEVSGRVRPFTWLPGFYRTFATREHALLCQCRERRVLGIAQWPETETGLWYAFVQPDRLRAVRWGALSLGRHARPALAVEYAPENHAVLRRRRAQETLYIACADEAQARRILADLLADSPAVAEPPDTSE